MNLASCADPITLTNQGNLDCTSGWVTTTVDELVNLAIVGEVFSVPATEDLTQAFAAGFGFPVIFFLVALGFNAVVGFLPSR
jgi:hypothetical protein